MMMDLNRKKGVKVDWEQREISGDELGTERNN
jgi:hypothetical protein